jgi:hypothetical protein
MTKWLLLLLLLVRLINRLLVDAQVSVRGARILERWTRFRANRKEKQEKKDHSYHYFISHLVQISHCPSPFVHSSRGANDAII